MTKKERAAIIVERLKKEYPDSCSLEATKDYELLFATRLAAQCTDARVNMVTEVLYSRYPTLEALAAAPEEDIAEIVKPCGLFRTTAKSLKESAAMLLTTYEGRVPDTMEELLSLPGVGRKIANLLLGDIYKKGGIVADTHCIRICGRLGFYDEELKDPLRVERILTPVIPVAEQSDFCHRIVHFGREICTARSPKCEDCPMREICDHGKEA